MQYYFKAILPSPHFVLIMYFYSGKKLIYNSLIRASAVFFSGIIFSYSGQTLACSSLLYLLLILSSSLYLYSVSTLFLYSPLLFPWWKLSEASPSATVFIYTRLCPLLKAFLCCSTLWALSCLVSLLVTLLALTDSQVKCVLRAACVCVFVTSALSFHSSITICHTPPVSVVWCDSIWIREVYDLTGTCLGLAIEKTHDSLAMCRNRVCRKSMSVSPLHVCMS